MQDETSISHSEIFGEEITYTDTITQKRDSKLLQFLLGDKERQIQKVARGPGMRAQTLQRYIDLMQEHSERVKRQREKSKVKKNKLGKK